MSAVSCHNCCHLERVQLPLQRDSWVYCNEKDYIEGVTPGFPFENAHECFLDKESDYCQQIQTRELTYQGK